MYEVRRLKRTDGKLINAICESLKTAYDPNVSRFFVHQDSSYQRFFNYALEHPSYATYYSYDLTSGELSGFACFQIIEGIIFLKHIVVDNRLRGSRMGTKLLAGALQDIQKCLPAGDYSFQLHVFEKNSRALSWYLSIGMELIDCTFWYDLMPAIDKTLCNNEVQLSLFRTTLDTFGFKQLAYEDFYIGTVLADRTLIVKNPLALERLDLLACFIKENKLTSIGHISQTLLHFHLVDKALLMSKPVHSLELI